MPPEDKITIRLSLENLIIEGSRQLREWEQLQDEIPSLDMALKFVDGARRVNLRDLNLSVEEWRVVRFINSKNTIHKIARTTSMNDLEIRRIVYSLIQAGLVEILHPEG
jgi:DNA-binding MarR family transcriptional regulator